MRVKAPKGLMHHTLPAQDSSTVKGKSNQQDVILKALRDCGKVRAEAEDQAKPFAPAYILQKVWLSGIDHWTTKSLREEFAKNLALNMPIEAEIPKLRETVKRGLVEGQWDMKVGERLFIKTDGTLTPPEPIEFSERMVLYRRGILQPPKPKEVELSAQVLSSTEATKPVRVRWKARGALTVSLYQDERLIREDFRPSDEYEGNISQTTGFKIVADYGNGEVEQRQTQVMLTGGFSYGTGGSRRSSTVSEPKGIFQVKPEQIDLEGTPNSVFTALSDRCSDDKVQEIQSLELSVDQVMDYRKLGTALPLLSRSPLQIDQNVTIQTGDFIRFEYQGAVRGFQSFFSTLNTLLNTANVQADVNLKLTFEFDNAVSPGGTEINTIKQALLRNPVERLYLSARVMY
jgi:hypothetical protein